MTPEDRERIQKKLDDLREKTWLTPLCEHGSTRPTQARRFACPVAKCLCCQLTFGYLGADPDVPLCGVCR